MAKATAKKQQKTLDSPESEPEMTQNPEPAPIEPEKEPEIVSQQETVSSSSNSSPVEEKKKPKPPRSGIIDRLNALESWEGCRVYLYRHQPMQNKMGNHNVKTYTRAFDEDDIMKDKGLGSGVYEVVLNWTNPQTRVRVLKDSGMVSIMNMEYPPRIPKGEWMDDPKNIEWAWAKEVLDREDAAKNVPLVEAKNEANPLVPVLDMMKEQQRANEQRMARLEQLLLDPKRNTEHESILSVLLQKALAPPPPPPPPDPIMTAMLTKLTQPDPLQAMVMQHILKQMETKTEAAAPKDPVDELEKMLDIQTKLEERIGSRNGGSRARLPAWMEWTSQLAGPFTEMMKPFAQMMAMNMARQQQAQNNGRQQQPSPQLPAIGAPSQPAEFQEVTEQQRPKLVPRKPTIQAIANQLLYHLQANKDGYQLGDWYLEAFGPKEFEDLRLQGKVKLVVDLQGTETWKQIATFPHHDQVIIDLLTWEPAAIEEEEEEPDGDEEDTLPVSAAPPGSNPWTSPKENASV